MDIRRCPGWLSWASLAVALLAIPWLAMEGLQASRTAPALPLWCDRPVHDYGKVRSTDPIDHEFVLTHRGSKLIEGLVAMPGCGCMKLSLSATTVAPGERVTVSVHMEMQSYRGAQEHAVYLSDSNSTSGRSTTLIMRGSIGE
jgi:Protein of unknown function (DUF1573)